MKLCWMSVSGIISSSWPPGLWAVITELVRVQKWEAFWGTTIHTLSSELGVGQPPKGAGNHMGQKDKLSSENELVSVSVSSVQSLSRVRLFATPWITARQASLSITSSRSLLKLMSIESVMPSSHLILCLPLLLLPPIPPSIRVFSNESTLRMRWPKYWSFRFSISPSNEHPGLISFRMDWLDLLAVQGTLKSLLQYHGSKASIFWHSAFFSFFSGVSLEPSKSRGLKMMQFL